jgi:hypothetical protein
MTGEKDRKIVEEERRQLSIRLVQARAPTRGRNLMRTSRTASAAGIFRRAAD